MNHFARFSLSRFSIWYAVAAALWVGLADWFVRAALRDGRASSVVPWALVGLLLLAGLLSLYLLHRFMAETFNRSLRDLRLREQRFLHVFNAVSEAVFVHHPVTGEILDANQRAIDMYGYSGETLRTLDVGQLSTNVLPYTMAEAKVKLLKAMTEGPQRFDWLARHQSGTVFWVEVTLRLAHIGEEDVVLAMVHDISERKHLEQSLRRRQAMYAVLSGSNQAIIHACSRQELFDLVCQAMLKIGLFRLVWIGAPQQGLDLPVVPLAYAGYATEFLEELSNYTWNQLIEAGTPAGRAWQGKTHVIEKDFSTLGNPLVVGLRVANVHGLLSCMSMVIGGGGFQGTLTAYASEKDFFDDEVEALMLEVAKEVSFALNNLREAERQVATMERMKLFARVFEESRDGILICDRSNLILMANRAITTLFGYQQDELIGQSPRMLRSGQHDTAFYREMWDAMAKEGCWQGEVWDRRKDGELFPCWAKIYIIRDEEEQVSHYFEVISDLSEHRAREELQWMKRYDLLTRLPNRSMLEEYAAAAIAYAREHIQQVAMLSINLDRFHYVNESLGHMAGDQVLKIMAERFSEVLGEQCVLSRLSGGAFVALLPALHNPQQAESVANRLLKVASRVYELEGIKISQTVCIGIALFPVDGDDFKTLLKHADCARMEAASHGGNHFRFFVHALNERVRDRLSLSTDLVQALEHDRFELYFQPQVAADDGELTGVEVLLRLRHPTQGLISPGDFIPVAEETGLIVPLGAWVIRDACRQLRLWQALDVGTLSINLSPLQLQDPQLFEIIMQALDVNQIVPALIEFEITENALMRNSISTLNQLNRLKQLGVRLSIDDFGTGYSNLSYLKQFPVDRLKIDQAFVRGVPTDSNDVAIVDAILAVARALGLSTLAEGVETQAQADFLRARRCDEFQGYLYSRPLPANEFEAWLHTRRLIARHG
ncbi:bifunctional diguanylate cyclase/phosphodiesterase [Paludibacterium purpuratum]|uniref:PAS domain S-box-containing protein/diguanylate cyclase (GGDEF)-like protein n=1 Tax=Paludibacterium purpuratum TaxID=1144873 RepID=A0A4R7BCU2_9NEIS|nr:EAL domain-containing protein [Paludibacterium purpuratum]TDR81982.1 PAS domain S-box-containing protein/diguanylate cyclase (GGDEF)-like protein [Paludibacterium purpuratum]